MSPKEWERIKQEAVRACEVSFEAASYLVPMNYKNKGVGSGEGQLSRKSRSKLEKNKVP